MQQNEHTNKIKHNSKRSEGKSFAKSLNVSLDNLINFGSFCLEEGHNAQAAKETLIIESGFPSSEEDEDFYSFRPRKRKEKVWMDESERAKDDKNSEFFHEICPQIEKKQKNRLERNCKQKSVDKDNFTSLLSYISKCKAKELRQIKNMKNNNIRSKANIKNEMNTSVLFLNEGPDSKKFSTDNSERIEQSQDTNNERKFIGKFSKDLLKKKQVMAPHLQSFSQNSLSSFVCPEIRVDKRLKPKVDKSQTEKLEKTNRLSKSQRQTVSHTSSLLALHEATILEKYRFQRIYENVGRSENDSLCLLANKSPVDLKKLCELIYSKNKEKENPSDKEPRVRKLGNITQSGSIPESTYNSKEIELEFTQKTNFIQKITSLKFERPSREAHLVVR